jgi:hypothetical protein
MPELDLEVEAIAEQAAPVGELTNRIDRMAYGGGRSWEDRTKGLPSIFGFPICVHPRDPNVIWTLPLNGDMAGRFPADAAAAVCARKPA